jgi:hypothetical protein
MSHQGATPAFYRMYHSTVLSAPIDQAWAELRDFASAADLLRRWGQRHHMARPRRP